MPTEQEEEIREIESIVDQSEQKANPATTSSLFDLSSTHRAREFGNAIQFVCPVVRRNCKLYFSPLESKCIFNCPVRNSPVGLK